MDGWTDGQIDGPMDGLLDVWSKPRKTPRRGNRTNKQLSSHMPSQRNNPKFPIIITVPKVSQVNPSNSPVLADFNYNIL